jgi:hypothetical protein
MKVSQDVSARTILEMHLLNNDDTKQIYEIKRLFALAL